MVIAIPSSGAFNVPRISSNGIGSKKNFTKASGLIAALGVCSCSAVLLQSRRNQSSRFDYKTYTNARFKLNNMTIAAISGGVAEVVGVLALYPLDTLKVYAQASSHSLHKSNTVHTIRNLVKQQGLVKTISNLYRGVGITTLGACFMGSIYLSAFYLMKGVLSPASFSTPSIATQTSTHKSTVTGNMMTPAASSSSSSSSSTACAASGIFASMLCSAIEAPIEALKIKSQLNLPRSLPLATSPAGAMNILYASFIPYLLKAVPHDVAELFTFSQLDDSRQGGNKNILGRIDAHCGPGAGDVVMGASAGAAAAVVSMPFDTIFTRMNLNTACMVNAASGLRLSGIKESISAFFSTGKMIVMKNGGPGALFAGLGPRLASAVPAGILYWYVVESTRRALLEHNKRMDVCASEP